MSIMIVLTPDAYSANHQNNYGIIDSLVKNMSKYINSKKTNICNKVHTILFDKEFIISHLVILEITKLDYTKNEFLDLISQIEYLKEGTDFVKSKFNNKIMFTIRGFKQVMSYISIMIKCDHQTTDMCAEFALMSNENTFENIKELMDG